MSLTWSAIGDFTSAIDGLESVTLRRRGSVNEVTIPSAKRDTVTSSEAEPSGGYVVGSDARWVFEMPQGARPPSIGDSLLDVDGNSWTLLKLHYSGAGGPLRCHTRNLAIGSALESRINIQRASWQDLGSGPEIVGWTTIRSAVPARVQPIAVEVDRQSSPLESTSRFRAMLVDEFRLDHNYRLVDSKGRAYEIDSYTQAERIDALAIAEVSVVEAVQV